MRWRIIALASLAAGCHAPSGPPVEAASKLPATAWAAKTIQGARDQLDDGTGYDGAYVKLSYPMGDPPPEKGVCTDVIVRALRKAGLDLQQKIHEDMKAAWSEYPRYAGSPKPDTNIDHRRVPNQRVYFKRHATTLTMRLDNPADWQPGDIVTWKIGHLDHVGILTDTPDARGYPLVLHNAGAGPSENDALFAPGWVINGHYRLAF